MAAPRLVPQEVRDLVVRLRRGGRSYRDIAHHLEFVTEARPLGRAWYPATIRKLCRQEGVEP